MDRTFTTTMTEERTFNPTGLINGSPPRAGSPRPTHRPTNPSLPADFQNPPAGLPKLPAYLSSVPISPPSSTSNIPDDQLLDQDIRRAVDAQLAEKGLTKVDKGGDLLVGYQTHVREERA